MNMLNPCKLDHNGECIICDCTIDNCAWNRYINNDFRYESKEELEAILGVKKYPTTLDIIADALTEEDWNALRLKMESKKAFHKASLIEVGKSKAIQFADWILKHNLVNGYDEDGSSCWVVANGKGEVYDSVQLYNIFLTGVWPGEDEEEYLYLSDWDVTLMDGLDEDEDFDDWDER
jgi:hypothetical protein